MLNSIYQYLLLKYSFNQQENYTQAKITLNASLLTSLFSISYAILYYLEDFKVGGIFMFLVGIFFLFIGYLLRSNLSLNFIGNLFVINCWLPAIVLIYLTGGIHSGVLPWLSIIPLTANLLVNQKTALIWLIISILTGGCFGIWEAYIQDLPIQFASKYEIFNLTLSTIGLSAITLLIVSTFNQAIYQYQNELKNQQHQVQLFNQQLRESNQEMMTQNEELHQQQEEIITQRDFIEQKSNELEQTNRRIQANESILKKAMAKLKESEEQIQIQNQTLIERNRLVNSSLNAAKTIQNAILPYQEKLDNLLENYFVLYQPKDVVSGDFYWLNKVGNNIILIVADCTGHGVPGAFMTLIGNILLDKIVRVWNILSPAQILTRLHEEVRIVLRQAENSNNNGMDMAVINLEDLGNQQYKIIYSGAKLPFFYISSQDKQVKELAADRKAIGGEQNEAKQFSNQEIILPKNSLIYMASDGYTDQNNEKRIRFGNKRFLQLVNEIQDRSFREQEIIFRSELEKQMLNTTQRDDILLLGFQLG